jgi:hypothetical protein
VPTSALALALALASFTATGSRRLVHAPRRHRAARTKRFNFYGLAHIARVLPHPYIRFFRQSLLGRRIARDSATLEPMFNCGRTDDIIERG